MPNLSFRAIELAAAFSLLLPALPARALDTVLENVTYKAGPDGTAALPRVEITGANLSQAELTRLFDEATPKDERKALAQRLKADRIVAPQLIFNSRHGKVVASDLKADGIDTGRVTHFSMAGATGDFTDDKGAKGTLKVGPVEAEGTNAAATLSDLGAVSFVPFNKFTWQGLDLQMPDPDAQPGQPPGQMKVHIDSVEAQGSYDGNVPLRGQGSVKGIVFEPAPGSKAALGMRMAGYDKLQFGFTFDGTYDPATKAYTLDDYTVEGINIGSIGMKAKFADIPKEAFTAEKQQKLAALMQGSIGSLQLRVVNAGFFEKAVAFYALQHKQSPNAVKDEWTQTVTQILPVVLAGDPGAVKISQAIASFIRDPKAITITAKAKDKPLAFGEVTTIHDPISFLQRVELGADNR